MPYIAIIMANHFFCSSNTIKTKELYKIFKDNTYMFKGKLFNDKNIVFRGLGGPNYAKNSSYIGINKTQTVSGPIPLLTLFKVLKNGCKPKKENIKTHDTEKDSLETICVCEHPDRIDENYFQNYTTFNNFISLNTFFKYQIGISFYRNGLSFIYPNQSHIFK